MFPNQQGRDSWGSVAGMSTKFSSKIVTEIFSGYYGNYNMGGGAGPGGGGSWYRGTGGGAHHCDTESGLKVQNSIFFWKNCRKTAK